MDTIQVVIADPLESSARKTASILSEERRIEVLGIASSLKEAQRMVEILRPHVLISELTFDDGEVPPLVRHFQTMSQGPGILVLARQARKGDPLLDSAIGSGAGDFIQRPDNDDDFERLERILVTKILVIGFAKTKIIPKRGAEVKEAVKSRFQSASLVVVAAPPERRDDLMATLCRMGSSPMSTYLVLPHLDEPATRLMADELFTLFDTTSHVLGRPSFLTPQSVFLLPKLDQDIEVEPFMGGRFRLKSVPRGGELEPGWKPASSEPVPSLTRILHSASRIAGKGLAVVYLGRLGTAAALGLAFVARAGGFTVLETGHENGYPPPPSSLTTIPVPEAVLSIEQIRAAMSHR